METDKSRAQLNLKLFKTELFQTALVLMNIWALMREYFALPDLVWLVVLFRAALSCKWFHVPIPYIPQPLWILLGLPANGTKGIIIDVQMLLLGEGNHISFSPK